MVELPRGVHGLQSQLGLDVMGSEDRPWSEGAAGKPPGVQADWLPRGAFLEQIWGMVCPPKKSKVE